MDAKRQLEAQVVLQQKTKELLSAAELELNTLRLQLGSSEARRPLSSPSTPTVRGEHQPKCVSSLVTTWNLSTQTEECMNLNVKYYPIKSNHIKMK